MKKQTYEYFKRWLEDKGITDYTKAYVIGVDGKVKQLDHLKFENDEDEGRFIKNSVEINSAIGSRTFTLVPTIDYDEQYFTMFIDDEGMFTQQQNVPLTEWYRWMLINEHGAENIKFDYTHLFGPVLLYWNFPKEFKTLMESI
jgi:hypothetical protein